MGRAVGFFLGLGIVLTGLWPGVAKADDRCGSRERPVVVLDSDPGSVRLHTDRDSRTLDRMRERSGLAARGKGWLATGLTVAALKYQVRIEVTSVRLGPGRYCVSVKRADAFVGLNALDVYIASKYRRGSCEYKTVLTHEYTHVGIFRDVLGRHLPKVRRSLQQAASDKGVVMASSPQAGVRHLQSTLQAAVMPAIKEISQAQDEANARIDTPENYRREQSGCRNW